MMQACCWSVMWTVKQPDVVHDPHGLMSSRGQSNTPQRISYHYRHGGVHIQCPYLEFFRINLFLFIYWQTKVIYFINELNASSGEVACEILVQRRLYAYTMTIKKFNSILFNQYDRFVFFIKKLIQSFKMFKSDSKDIYNVTKDLFQRNVVSLNFLFIKYSTKATVFNINNNNINNNDSFFHTKSAY